MAKIRVFKSLANGRFTITFTNEAADISDSDLQLMADYGEPELNVGGSFLSSSSSSSSGDSSAFILPDQYIKLRSGFPYTRTLDSSDYSQVQVAGYITQILANIDVAFVALRAQPDTFTGEELHTI